MSVKSPYEKKPGMKMSTYGGDKRRPNFDRYFDQNASLRESLDGQNALDVDAGSSIFSSQNG